MKKLRILTIIALLFAFMMTGIANANPLRHRDRRNLRHLRHYVPHRRPIPPSRAVHHKRNENTMHKVMVLGWVYVVVHAIICN